MTRVLQTPRSRVELHAHLDGCVRTETIWELMDAKSMGLPDGKKWLYRELRDALIITKPIDLLHFLTPFGIFLPCLQDDFKAIERIAYEFCEDKANSHVLYVEARYAPHSFLTQKNTNWDNLLEVVRAVNRGFKRGENDFHVQVRTLLCFLNAETAEETLKLVHTFQTDGVVGIDRAGSFKNPATDEEVPLGTKDQQIYELAAKDGVHRTVHAGERGPAEMVRRAVVEYQTERVGHGYHVVQDNKIYQMCKDKNVHFECCPWSSFLTGSVPLNVIKHPIVQFSEDKVNFSFNTDDTTITGKTLIDDYSLSSSWGLTEAHFVRANLNAANACFLPSDDKLRLSKQLKMNYGLE